MVVSCRRVQRALLGALREVGRQRDVSIPVALELHHPTGGRGYRPACGVMGRHGRGLPAFRPAVAPEDDWRMSRGFQNVLDHIRAVAGSEVEKGRLFERLMKAYFEQDPLYRDRFSDVWLWSQWTERGRTSRAATRASIS